MLKEIYRSIEDKKGENTVILNVKGLSPITDYLVVTSGNVPTHTQAIADEILKNLKDLGEIPLNVEGLSEGRWIVLDYGDVIVNLFIPELREYYNLEWLWADAPRVNL